MDLFPGHTLNGLIAAQQPPCVSLYLRTHRGGAPEDAVRFRQLADQAQGQLVARGMRPADARDFLVSARALEEDHAFWKHQSDGLVLFRAEDFFQFFRVPVAFADQAFVGRRFQVTPLLPLLTGNGRFYILALSQNGVRLLQATRDTVSAVDLRHGPRNLAEALRAHDTDEPLTYHSRPASVGGAWTAVYHGQGVGIDDKKDDLLRYFRQVDHALHEVLHGDGLLVVAAVEYLLPIFREASTYPHLFEHAVAGSPDRVSDAELHRRAWELVAPTFQAGLRRDLDQFGQMHGTGHATADSGEVISAAHRGDVAALFLAQGKTLWGRSESRGNSAELHAEYQPGDDELLNFAAADTLRHHGRVYALRPEEMPGGGVVAAILHPHRPVPTRAEPTAAGTR